jgi:hypothetical protein
MPTSGAVPGAHRRADARARQQQPQRECQCERDTRRDQPVQRHRAAQDLHRYGEVGVREIRPAEDHQQHALHDEQQAEGGENAVHLQRAGIGRATHQRHHRDAVHQPVDGEARGHGDGECCDRVHARHGEQHIGREAGGDGELAVGQVHDARDAVLQREADGDQRVDAAEHQARQHDVEQEHAVRPGARRAWGIAPARACRRHRRPRNSRPATGRPRAARCAGCSPCGSRRRWCRSGRCRWRG